jgi:acetyltransferase
MPASWKNTALDAIFNPRSIAVIGASDKPRKLGHLTFRALQSSNFPGAIHLVNPSREVIRGHKTHGRIQEVPEPVDLALIAVQGFNVPTVLADCAEKRVKGAVIYSSGFKELGSPGAALEEEVARIANKARIGVIGPNCLGVGNVRKQLNATFFPHPALIKPGGVSFVSQSGGVAGLMLYTAVDAQLGIAKYASIGNRVNLDFADLIHYLGQDSETHVICLFVEGTEDARRMMNEARRVTPRKPILAFKVGKTPIAQQAALSHTGSLAGRGELYSSAFRQACIQEVEGITELIDTAKILSLLPYLPRGNRVACITHTLGPTIIATEILENRGIQLPPPHPDTVRRIQAAMELPVPLPISNPIDLLALGWARPDVFAQALRIAANEDQYDAFLTVFSPNFQDDIGGGTPTEGLIQVTSEFKKPLVAILNAPESFPPREKQVLEDAGIPVFSSPERGARALANVMLYATAIKRRPAR